MNDSDMIQQAINDLPARLHDIRELDAIGWWPLAPGWWLVIGGLLLLLFLLGRFLMSLLRDPPGSWRREAKSLLVDLRKRQPNQPPKQTAEELSELLRRISIARFGREECAALSGTSWLQWLQQHDPNGFDWPKNATLLLDLPYAPIQQGTQNNNLEALIKAALQMLAASQEKV